MLTRIGNDNLLMNYAHVGHDSYIVTAASSPTAAPSQGT